MAGDNFRPVLSGAPVISLKEQPSVVFTKPELRLASQSLDSLSLASIDAAEVKLSHSTNSKRF